LTKEGPAVVQEDADEEARTVGTAVKGHTVVDAHVSKSSGCFVPTLAIGLSMVKGARVSAAAVEAIVVDELRVKSLLKGVWLKTLS